MLNRIVISIFLLFALSVGPVASQASSYRLETFGTRDGLISSKIFTLYQTSDRMLWIGTELGLSIYNGYSFTNHQYSSSNESIGRVLCITQDSERGVWFGGDKGLYYYYKGKIEKISVHSRSSLAIEVLHTDHNGDIWVGDLNAMYKITSRDIRKLQSGGTGKLDLFPFANFDKRVFGVSEDNQHNLYVASYDGIFRFPVGTTRYETVWTNPDPVHYVRSVAAISKDSIYWNRLDDHPEQLLNGQLNKFISKDFVGRSVFTNKQKPYALTTSGVASIANNSIIPIVSIEGISHNAVAALIDAEENIWIGSWEGLLKYRKTSFRLYSLQQSLQTEAFSMLERKDGELLFGSNRGRIFYKKNNAIIPKENIPQVFPLAEVLCMAEATDGSTWFGSGYQGISSWNQGQLRRWKQDSILQDENCEALYPVEGGKWLACTERGVTLVDPALAYPMVEHYPYKKIYTRYPELFGCFSSGGKFWFYGSQGLYSLVNKQLLDDSIGNMPVKSLYINKIIQDRKLNIWIATQGLGLLKCKLENNQIILVKKYDKQSGAPSDNALSVIADNSDNIWWGDYMSISLLAGENTLISFNEKDGLLSSYYQTLKLEKLRDGTIWGLTSMGLFNFHPDSIGKNDLPPFLILDSSTFRTGGMLPLSKPFLSYKDNSIQFHYTAICLSDPSKVRYAYRLKGLDSNWTYTSERTATFNFLQPGNYEFEVKASNNNNVWTTSKIGYIFSIRPPFWKTWWFRALIASLAGLLVYLLFRRRISAFKHKSVIKQQMAELEAKAIRAQMNPHFIFNSLNAIQESIVLNDFDTSYQYLSKFSKLLRQVLNNSEKNIIPLSAEIEMNRLYLELESLRFKHSFSYSIVVDESIDPEMTKFPSLMIQPFIENAIWHGLMQKKGEKILLVQFSQSARQLFCVIEDNGIGRTKAADIKKNKLGAHHFESKGTDLARQRIKLLQDTGTMEATLDIQDLKNENGIACGTRVTISLPLIKSD